jgi:hypothetical protein
VTINRLFEILTTLIADVNRIGTGTEAMADKVTPASPIHKRHCPDNREDPMEHNNAVGMQ